MVNRTGSVADIPDDELLRRVVIQTVKAGRRKDYAWAKVMDAFGLGSTYSVQMCRRFGLDPDTGKPTPPDNAKLRCASRDSGEASP